MAINIGNNADGDVTYQNPPVNRVLFPNITYEAKPEEIQTAVNVWLNNHPEATTTVEDGSILPVKLDSSNSATDGYILSYNATAGKFEWVSVNADTLGKIATPYDTESLYSAGDICSYNGKIYKCIASENTIIQGEFDSQYWTEKVSIGQIVEENLDATNSELSDLKQDYSQLLNSAYVTETITDAVIASFADGADDVPVKSLTVDITPVQSGSGDPSPENVRPISGWTGANVSVAGKNLLAKPFIHNSNTSVNINDCFPIKAGSYVFSFETITATLCRIGVRIFDTSGNILNESEYNPSPSTMAWYSNQGCWLYTSDSSIKEKTLTFAQDCYIRIIFAGGDTDATTTATGAQLELGSTATAYEPYKCNVYSITFPTESGTVYGGTLDVTSGVLTVDRVFAQTTTDTTKLAVNVEGGTTYRVMDSTQPRTGKSYSITVCNQYSNFPRTFNSVLETPYSVGNTGTNERLDILVNDSRYETANALKSYLLEHPLQFVADLNEAVVIQLTPTEVATILGQNNIFADTGDIAELTYRADLKAYIDAHVGT